MAAPVTNCGANKYSNLVGQIDRQSGTKQLLVGVVRGASEREIPQSIIKGGDGADGLIKSPSHKSVLDLAENPTKIQSYHCGVSDTCILRGFTGH